MVFSDLKINRAILELKYDRGYLYLDRCGRTHLKILEDPEWEVVQASPENTLLKNKERNLELNFNHLDIHFVQEEVENLNQFKAKTSKIIPIITTELEIKIFKRIGNRYWFIHPVENIEQGEKLIRKTGILNISEDKVFLFGKSIKNSSIIIVIENENLNYRIGLKIVERDDKKIPKNLKINETFNPKCGLLIDVDIFTTTSMKVEDFDASEFIQRNHKVLENNLINFIKGG